MPVQLLLIDTDVRFIVRLKQALEEHDFTVRTIGRPTVGLEELDQNQFDVAIIDLNINQVGDLITNVRRNQPGVPIVLSGQTQLDLDTITQYRAQGYIHKPYTARDLIPVIEQAIARGHMAQENEARSNDHHIIPEPPTDEESTIGELLAGLDDVDHELAMPAGGEDWQQALPPDTLPESVSGEPAPTKADDTPAVEVLKLANNDEMVDSLLLNSQLYPTVRPLPSWQVPNTADQIARVEAIIGTPVSTTQMEEPPYASITRPFSVPEVDLLPDPEDTTGQHESALDPNLLDALADDDDSQLQAVLQNAAPPPEDEELVAKSVDEITQAMGVIDLDDEADLQHSPDAEAVDELLGEIDVVAHAALQLTQFSLESSAVGILLTYNDYPVARTGTLQDETWGLITNEVTAAWESETSSNTRVLYRDIQDLGHMLIFSIHTVDELVLTMIFGADTPLRIIRQQARRLADALELVPETAGEATSSPPADETVPPAARTTPSRPTDLKAPEKLREQQIKVPTEPPPVRDPGSYMGYACLWLLENGTYALEGELADAMKLWLGRAATNNDWDLLDVEIGESWINLHIEIPVKAIPGQVIKTLMQTLQEELVAAQKITDEAPGAIWANSYSVTTPGRLHHADEIERFIRFHQEQSYG